MRWPFMLKRTHDRLTIQHADYARGVLEGKRQGYMNVRAQLADVLYTGDARLRAVLVPLLADLGKEEQAIVLESNGLAQQEQDFMNAPVTAIDFIKNGFKNKQGEK